MSERKHPFPFILFLAFQICQIASGQEQQMMQFSMANYSQLFVPLPQMLPQQLSQSDSFASPTISPPSSPELPILVNQIPSLPFCQPGQRFIVNHILYVCHQFDEQRRGFRPFACALRNRAESKLLTKNGTLDDQFFRYKCQDLGNGKLQFQALNCILNEIEIKPGQSLRRSRSEYFCIKDTQGMFRLIEKQMLHDFCLPGNRNESLMDGDKCPGMTVGTINAGFGSGSEVAFDTKLMTIVPSQQPKTGNKKGEKAKGRKQQQQQTTEGGGSGGSSPMMSPRLI